MEATSEDSVLDAPPQETRALQDLQRQIDEIYREQGRAYLVGADGESLEIPHSAFEALKIVVQAMAEGKSINLIPRGKVVSTQEAADMLGVSRPHLVKLLDKGELPHHRVGRHRRLDISDVLEYRQRRAVNRSAKLKEVVRISEEFKGGYT